MLSLALERYAFRSEGFGDTLVPSLGRTDPGFRGGISGWLSPRPFNQAAIDCIETEGES